MLFLLCNEDIFNRQNYLVKIQSYFPKFDLIEE